MEANTQRRSHSLVELFFAPAITVMNRLRYAWKFIVIGAVLLVPLLFLLYLQFQVTTKDLQFSASEAIGVDYTMPAAEMLHAVQRRKVLQAGVLAGDVLSRTRLKEATNDAESKVSKIDAVDALYGVELKSTEAWGRVKTAWKKLKESS